MPEELEERMRDALLVFIDMLYAVVFGLILIQTFDQIVLSEIKSLPEKTRNLFLVISVFYFLSWDWLHARRLTLKNPYTSYQRFFMEVIMAFLAYGAVLEAVRVRVTFLFYVFGSLFLGSLWAHYTLKEYPESEEYNELGFIRRYQALYALSGASITAYWYHRFSLAISLSDSIFYVIWGLMITFFYDLRIERPAGIMGGPGTPFISRELMEKIKRLLSGERR